MRVVDVAGATHATRGGHGGLEVLADAEVPEHALVVQVDVEPQLAVRLELPGHAEHRSALTRRGDRLGVGREHRAELVEVAAVHLERCRDADGPRGGAVDRLGRGHLRDLGLCVGADPRDDVGRRRDRLLDLGRLGRLCRRCGVRGRVGRRLGVLVVEQALAELLQLLAVLGLGLGALLELAVQLLHAGVQVAGQVQVRLVCLGRGVERRLELVAGGGQILGERRGVPVELRKDRECVDLLRHVHVHSVRTRLGRDRALQTW